VCVRARARVCTCTRARVYVHARVCSVCARARAQYVCVMCVRARVVCVMISAKSTSPMHTSTPLYLINGEYIWIIYFSLMKVLEYGT